ncbi:MAG TPA: SDR family oxidoreductase [Chloroflexota bacterium]
MRVNDMVAIISDLQSEPGRAAGKALAAAGANVAGFCSSAKAADTLAQIESAGGKCVLVDGRPANPADAERLVKETLVQFGRIDVLVNNGDPTSTHGRVTGTIFDVTDEEFDGQMDSDAKAIIVLSRTVVPAMAKQGSGSIINFSSVASAGVKGRAMRSLSKAAVNALTCAMALDHGPDGIRVNALLTGPLGGPQFSPEQVQQLASEAALKHLHTRDDEANAILFLSSDQSRSITGALIPLDAGRSLAQH